MMKKSKISVIVPVYNTAQYLQQCLDSILNQTLKDIEVICVDDGSTDISPQILDSYAAADERIKVIHKENGGLVSARKVGLKATTGEYIGYVDSDDWIEPDMYEKLREALINEEADIAMCGHYEDTENAHKKMCHGIMAGRYDKAALLEKVYPRMMVNDAFFEWGIFPSVCDKLFKHENLEDFQMGIDERIVMGEDAACTYPALLNAQSLVIREECLYHYRQNTTSMVRRQGKGKEERERFQILYHSVRQRLEEDRDIFDLTDQWEKYLLFLMVPRADILLDGMGEFPYLFPFPEVEKGSEIILYGMGLYGQRLYMYLQESGFCRVAACVDRNYKELNGQGLQVIPPEEIGEAACDTIVVAASFAKTRAEICKKLREKYPDKKVCTMEEDLIMSDEIVRRFGLSRI